MNPDPIKQLLREADDKRMVSSPDPDLVARVLRVSQRRSIARMGTAALLLVAVFTIVIANRDPAPLGRVLSIKVEPAAQNQTDAESIAIKNEIAAHEKIVSQLMAIERRTHNRAQLASLALLPSSDDAAERAASAVVYQADRAFRGTDAAGPALKAYHEVINYFPATISADLARKRVAELGEKEG